MQKYKDDFENKSILLIVDTCSFGSNYESIQDWCIQNRIKIEFPLHYKSFEYLLLKSNYFKDNIEQFEQKNLLCYASKEVLYFERILQLLQDSKICYNKSGQKFSTCFIDNCKHSCRDTCDFAFARKSNKTKEALKGTEFEYFLTQDNKKMKEMSLFGNNTPK